MNIALLGLARIHGIESHAASPNSSRCEHSGQVFPDWFSPETQGWWTNVLSDWFASGVQFSGIWLDMNEVSSFCDGSWFVQFILASLIDDGDRSTAVAPAQI